MKERPILFSAPMVRAILEGRKTQQRRVVKLSAFAKDADRFLAAPNANGSPSGAFWPIRRGATVDCPIQCPYGQPGDRLWVRETWVELLAVSPATDRPIEIGPGERLIEPPTSWQDSNGHTRWNYDGRVIAYRANSDIEFCDGDGFGGEFADRSDMPRWRPSIHMPRWASRITLEITDVRVQRVQDISEEDAIEEGICRISHGREGYFYHATRTDPHPNNWIDPCDAFRELWDSINAKRGFGWDANPWVWALTFRRIDAEPRT